MSGQGAPTQFRRRILSALESRLAIDLRALAAFRIGLGCVIILDLLLRLRNLRTFYTDAGVFPVAQLAEQYPLFAQYSLHAQSGAAWLQLVLFALAAVFAVALVVGYKTRLVTFVSLGLLLSLHARNPHVLNAGDSLLEHVFVWSLFLPLGRRWSIDARQHDTSQQRAFSVASGGLLVQVVLVYAVNAVLKTRSDAWMSGDATATVLGLDQFAVLLAPVLRDIPLIPEVAHWTWMVLLLSSPLLVLTTGRIRALLVTAFAAVHAGMLVSLLLGIFPIVSIVALIPFLPSNVWDVLGRTRAVQKIASQTGRLSGTLAGVLPTWSPIRARLRGGPWRPAGQSVAAVLLVGIILFNSYGLGFVPAPPPVDDGSSDDRVGPRWTMFAPEPLDTERWFAAPGKLRSGGRVDAFHQTEMSWEPPDNIARSYPSARMRKYMSNVRYDELLQESFADYLCHRWNRTHDAELQSTTVYAVETDESVPTERSWQRTELVNVSCQHPASQ